MVKSKRRLIINKKEIRLEDQVETFYEKIITKFGNSAKIDAPKRYIGKRTYVVILKKYRISSQNLKKTALSNKYYNFSISKTIKNLNAY
ncbi:MAG: DUF2080 family transposase-associated protein [Candidatus Micrarchaeia archaeon]